MPEDRQRKYPIALFLLAMLAGGVGTAWVLRSGNTETHAGSAEATQTQVGTPAPASTVDIRAAAPPTAEAAAAGEHPAAEAPGAVHRSSLPARRTSRSSGAADRTLAAPSSDSPADQVEQATANATQEPAPSSTASAEAPPAPPPTPTGRFSLRFRNVAGEEYRLVRVVSVVDGQTVSTRNNPQIASGTTATVYSGNIDVGQHEVGVFAEYQGNGGMFSYFQGYRFKVQSGRAVTVTRDRTSTLVATVVERGGPTVPFEKRLALNVTVN